MKGIELALRELDKDLSFHLSAARSGCPRSLWACREVVARLDELGGEGFGKEAREWLGHGARQSSAPSADQGA